jgi:hypothetical protein
MECAFNSVYTTKYGVVEQCNQNCVGNSDGGGGGVGGGVDMITIIIIAVTISLALGFCCYATSSSQDADKGEVHYFDESDKTARTEISGKVRTEANSTASVKNGILLETNLLQLLAPQCSPLRVSRKRR